MKLNAILSGLTLVLFCTVGFSQTGKRPIPRKKKVEKHQVIKQQVVPQQKIKKGVKSGALTKKEAAKLRAQQQNIAKTKHAAKADGVVTKKEKAVIHQKQKAAKRNIAHKKHNKVNKKK